MAENAFLAAVAAYLRGRDGLAAAGVGFAEPGAAGDLPAVVLSLEEARRTRATLGERAEQVPGGLEVTSKVELAPPVPAAGEPATPGVISPDRRRLNLPHGGLVRRDGATGPLAGDDLEVKVGASAQEVVSNPDSGEVTPPGPGEVRVEPDLGRLTFGDLLPDTGTVTATYFLSQWQEIEITRLSGVLRADVCAAAAAEVETLSAAAAGALVEARGQVPGLLWIGLTALGSIGAPELAAGARRRSARFRFDYEHEMNLPESSGGVLHRIRVDLKGLSADPRKVVEVDEIRRRST